MDFELTGLTVDHAPEIHALTRRWEEFWRVPSALSLEEIVEEFDDPHFDPALDSRGVWSGDRLVAFGVVAHHPSGERLERAFIDGRVDPDLRGNGIGRRLLAWQVERATEKLRACDPSLPWFIRAYEWDWIDDAAHLYRRFGLEPVRWFDEMIRPLTAAIEAQAPEDVSIVVWDDAPSDEVRLLANASFADHWGSSPRDADSWSHLLQLSTMRRDLSYVAMAEGRPVGFSLNAHFPTDEAVTGRRDGSIAVLGVDRDWRRRGIAAALIARSLEAFSNAGFTHATLEVDSASPTGAAGLYSRLGFETLHRTIASQIAVPAVSP